MMQRFYIKLTESLTTFARPLLTHEPGATTERWTPLWSLLAAELRRTVQTQSFRLGTIFLKTERDDTPCAKAGWWQCWVRRAEAALQDFPYSIFSVVCSFLFHYPALSLRKTSSAVNYIRNISKRRIISLEIIWPVNELFFQNRLVSRCGKNRITYVYTSFCYLFTF